ncbi:hypothetical protein GCM10027569_02170 [Flindersiella endophytica]
MAPTPDFDDAVSKLAELAAETSAFAGRLEAAESAANTPVTANDQLGAATVTLDESGRVSTVRLHARWQEKLPPDQLASAVLEAIQAAELRRVELWSEALTAAEARPAPVVSATESAATSRTDSLPVVDLAALAEESISLLASLNQPREPAADPARAELAAGDHARVVLTPDGSVSQLLLDATWVGRASLSKLNETLNDAFRTAYETLDARPSVPALPKVVSPELATVMQDPGGALLRYANWRGFDASSPDRSGSA